MASKIDHKELQKRLKEDEVAVMFGELTSKIKHSYEQHGGMILMVIGVIALAYVAYYLYQQKSQSDFVAVQEQFAVANTLIQQENFEEAAQQFGVLLQDFPDADISPVARLLRADSLFQQGDYETALSEYQTALSKLNGADAFLAQVGVIQSLRSLDQSSEALAIVQEQLPKAHSDELKNQLRYLEGACYEDLGQDENALEAYQGIDSTSSWFSQARQRIEWLEAEAAEPIN